MVSVTMMLLIFIFSSSESKFALSPALRFSCCWFQQTAVVMFASLELIELGVGQWELCSERSIL